jgi:iron complex transport system substrate-binding protein
MTRVSLPCAKLIAVLVLLAAASCAGASVSVRDDAGNVVTLARPAQRIVSLAPHATEILFAAGAGPRVVGVVAPGDWPLAARSVPSVGDSNALDVERIVALAPDLVVAWPYTMPAQLAALRARGAEVFMSDPRTIDGIAGDIEALGVLAGSESAARPVASALRARHAALRTRYSGVQRLAVFYEIWNDPLYTIGGHHLISEAINLCGGSNIFASLSLPAPMVSVEAVLAARPEAIVAGSDDGTRPPWLDDWKRWRGLPAVRANNLFVAQGDLLHRPGPRFIDGVEALCTTLSEARRNGAGAR